MSTPENVQGQKHEDVAKEPASAHQPATESMDITVAVQQLRSLVCGLGAGLLVVSLALSAFVYKQNRNLTAAMSMRQHQIVEIQSTQQPRMFALNELGKYSIGKPELMAIFTRHGIQITSPSEVAAPATKSPTTAH
ncbi:MAG TPA: hypothetical protein VL171_13270 [Verrucomicrobiae bacterium]|nr:hypothetical protein [Verrucomicrobiae bacterium]